MYLQCLLALGIQGVKYQIVASRSTSIPIIMQITGITSFAFPLKICELSLKMANTTQIPVKINSPMDHNIQLCKGAHFTNDHLSEFNFFGSISSVLRL